MHLLRVQVPEFRALKNVDIKFEKDLIRKVFPLGSQNGGGKSTLLQLIFVLLHCSSHPDRLPFLNNLLAQVSIPEGESHKVLAKMDIWDGEKIVQIEFLCCNDTFLEPLKSNGTATIGDISFSSPFREQSIKQKLGEIPTTISRLTQEMNNLKVTNEMTEVQKTDILKKKTDLEDKLKQSNEGSEKIKQEHTVVHSMVENLMEFLRIEKLHYINPLNAEKKPLLCRIIDMEVSETAAFLRKLADKIFLAAPSTQVYLFLSPDNRKLLFKAGTVDNYGTALKEPKTKLPGFFTYDLTSTEVITKSFIVARDQDFAERVNTGRYSGDHYQQVLNEMKQLLATGKKILPQLNPKDNMVEGVRFTTEDGTELYPEDLSHGELKRLGICVWSRKIENAIVLMDEVENAFHPDWQYQIVLDLMEWGPTNQYILATHSYELCQALTPAHVKELEPKLLPVR